MKILVIKLDINNINRDEDILRTMILKLLFMTDLWLGIIELNNLKYLQNKQANN